jgi:hypothetical protein
MEIEHTYKLCVKLEVTNIATVRIFTVISDKFKVGHMCKKLFTNIILM